MKPSDELGVIFQIQRWSVNDGDGIRSTVFFKGCPLRCRWCANPESWRHQVEILYSPALYSRCGRCVDVCPTAASSRQADGMVGFDRKQCTACGNCVNVCPTGARKIMGKQVSVADVMRVINRDAVFYRESGGGVTFSGGEPFAQPEFLRQLAAACQTLGLETAVETSGCFDLDSVRDVLQQLDCVFVDIKHMDEAEHLRLTGVSNKTILANIAAFSKWHPRVIVRVPLIHNVNDTRENIEALCAFLQQEAGVTGVELLPYHNYGQAKYEAVGADFYAFSTPDEETIAQVKQWISAYGIAVLDFK